MNLQASYSGAHYVLGEPELCKVLVRRDRRESHLPIGWLLLTYW